MIDKRRIEEWKAMLRRPDDGSPTGIPVNYLAREAVPALLAEREELIALLRKVSAWMDEINEGCPICEKPWGADPDIHTPGCRLASL